MESCASPPRVSIITACFNAERWLKQTIESVRLQTYPHIEYIVADGASTDGTVAIAQKHRDVVSKIVSKPDSGPAEALNNGFAAATGEILGFINADDLLKPDAVAKAVAALGDPVRPALVYRDVEFIDSEGHRTVGYGGRSRIYRPGRYSRRAHRLKVVIVAQQGSFWTRRTHELVGPFNQEIKTAFDGEWYARAAVAGAAIRYVPGIGASFRVHPDAISASPAFKQQWEHDAARVDAIWNSAGIAPASPPVAKLIRLASLVERAAWGCLGLVKRT